MPIGSGFLPANQRPPAELGYEEAPGRGRDRDLSVVADLYNSMNSGVKFQWPPAVFIGDFETASERPFYADWCIDNL
jgi:hypothetical protein